MMRFRCFCCCIFPLITLTATADPPPFTHHLIDNTLPSNDRVGDYGLTALADLDHSGHLAFIVGGRSPKPERLYWYESQSADKWIRHDVGTGYQSDVGLAAIDVDGDGWIDLVCSGVWFRNPGNTRAADAKWERFEFAMNAAARTTSSPPTSTAMAASTSS
jgi:hypothetical protein